MRVGSFDSGPAANPESPQHTGHALATIVDHLSNQNSQTHNSESGFRRNLKFATFEEADGLCKKHTTQWGKTCTPGGQDVPKLPH